MGRLPKDYSQYKIGKLQPLYIDETKPRGKGYNIYWVCQCDCGNLISKNTSELNEGIKHHRNMNCGCYTPLKNLIGQKFGKLTVIEHDDSWIANKENNWHHKWICKCDCGNVVSVYGNNLTTLHTTSCGCANKSIGEENIEKLLKENHINYAREYSFNDLRNQKKLRFDFAIFNNKNELIELIEFDGRQHNNEYTPWNSIETLKERQQRDELKNNYCKEHNIKLIRINYSERDSIDLKKLELEDYNAF